jgi:hypothetical protein
MVPRRSAASRLISASRERAGAASPPNPEGVRARGGTTTAGAGRSSQSGRLVRTVACGATVARSGGSAGPLRQRFTAPSPSSADSSTASLPMVRSMMSYQTSGLGFFGRAPQTISLSAARVIAT